MTTINKFILNLLISLSIISFSSCDTNLDLQPSDKITQDRAYNSIEACEQALIGVYDMFAEGLQNQTTFQYIFFFPDVMGEDVYVSQASNYGRFVTEYQYGSYPNYVEIRESWYNCYMVIDNANALIEGINKLPDSDKKKKVLGQALALRAYMYHFLVRIFAKPYGDNPEAPGLVLRKVSSMDPMPRSKVKDAYALIEEDLKDAIQMLENSDEKAFFDKRAAQAILARVYMDMGNAKATEAINNAEEAAKNLTLLAKEDYATNKFSDINSETIWAYKTSSSDNSGYLSIAATYYYADGATKDASGKITYKNVSSGYSSFRVSKNLIDLFDDIDVRKKNFPLIDGTQEYITHPTAGGILTSKFRHVSGRGQSQVNFLRASEMHLIIAEVAADNNQYPKARIALNTIRTARGLNDFSGTDAQLADEIQKERRRELFGEGHRIFDIKRRKQILNRYSVYDPNNQANNVLLEGHWAGEYLKPGDDKLVLPLPKREFDANKALTAADQNPGY